MIQKLPNIFVLCMHKAASTFVADVLLPGIAIRTAQYNLFNVGSAVIRQREQEEQETGQTPEWYSRSTHDQLLYCLSRRPLPASNGLIGRVYPGHLPAIEETLGHSLPNQDNLLVVVRRDPRDALISLYYSLAVSHNPNRIEGDPDVFAQTRQNLQGQDVCAGLKSLVGTSGMDVTTQEFMECTRLVTSHPEICDLPYELLLNKPRKWLKKFVQFANLGQFVDRQWTADMLQHLQPPKQEDPTRHKRRMRPGNWVEVFDDELRNMVEERVGPRMHQFGYVW